MLTKSSEMMQNDASPLTNGGGFGHYAEDSKHNFALENISIEQLIDGIMEVEFKCNGTVYCGTVFARDIDKRTLSTARAMYEQYEDVKGQPKQRGFKKRGRKHGGKKKYKAIFPVALVSKISRELEELTFQGDLTPPQYRSEDITNMETISSPQNSYIKCEATDKMAETIISSTVTNFYKDISPTNSDVKEEQYSDISDASKESTSSAVANSDFAIKNLCAPVNRPADPEVNPNMAKESVSNIPFNPMEARPPFPQWPNIPNMGFMTNSQQKMNDNYTILKESREMDRIYGPLKGANRFSMPSTNAPDGMRPPHFVNNSKPLPRGSENFQRPNFLPSCSTMSANSQRLPNPQYDILRFYTSLCNTMPNVPNQMPNMNPALMAAMCNPFLLFPRGVQNPGSNPQLNPMLSMADAFNMMRPQYMQRFPQNNPNPRGSSNSNMNSNNSFGRE